MRYPHPPPLGEEEGTPPGGQEPYWPWPEGMRSGLPKVADAHQSCFTLPQQGGRGMGTAQSPHPA